ncbi:unnamed protein product [Durusdinium trenchii]|uniref:Cation channel sperm-associated protein 1 (CatSper1) n=2 Tax=Durusdinium trenchii TaxID=1381693 RepID=A0ABP0R3A5_9DINO
MASGSAKLAPGVRHTAASFAEEVQGCVGSVGSGSAFFHALETMRHEYERLVAENELLHNGALHGALDRSTSQTFVSGGAGVVRLHSEGLMSMETLEQDVPQEAPVRSEMMGIQDKSESLEQLEKSIAKNRRSVFMPHEDVRTSIQSVYGSHFRQKTNMVGGTCSKVAKHPYFQNLDMLMICVYAVWMGIDADWNDKMLITDGQWMFQTADQVFCVYFVVELMIRFFAFTNCWDRIRDPWFVLDSILVPLTIFDTWAMTIISLSSNVDEQDATIVRRSEILRWFRTLRLFRIARVAKLVRFLPELQILLKAMLTAFRSVFFALLLLLASHYMLAIVFNVTLQNTTSGEAHFDTVLDSMQTLFVHCTLLDEVLQLIDALNLEGLYFHLVMVYFVMFINAITLMNILIGIVVEVISNVAAAERQSMKVKWVADVIAQFLGVEEGWIKQSELLDILRGSPAMSALKLVGVDRATLIETVDQHFKEFRSQNPDPEMSVEDFVELVLALRGSNTATVKDVVELRKVLGRSQEVLAFKVESLAAKFPSRTPPLRSSQVFQFGLHSGARLERGEASSTDHASVERSVEVTVANGSVEEDVGCDLLTPCPMAYTHDFQEPTNAASL